MFKHKPDSHLDQAVEVRVRDPKGKRFVISVREE